MPDITVVDVTGCGNAFCGAFLASWQARHASFSSNAVPAEPHSVWDKDGLEGALTYAGTWGCVAGGTMAEWQGVPGKTPLQLQELAQERFALVHSFAKAIPMPAAAGWGDGNGGLPVDMRGGIQASRASSSSQTGETAARGDLQEGHCSSVDSGGVHTPSSSSSKQAGLASQGDVPCPMASTAQDCEGSSRSSGCYSSRWNRGRSHHQDDPAAAEASGAAPVFWHQKSSYRPLRNCMDEARPPSIMLSTGDPWGSAALDDMWLKQHDIVGHPAAPSSHGRLLSHRRIMCCRHEDDMLEGAWAPFGSQVGPTGARGVRVLRLEVSKQGKRINLLRTVGGYSLLRARCCSLAAGTSLLG